MIPFIGPLLSLVSTGVSAWSEQKQAKIQQKTTLETKKLDRLQSIEDNDAAWDKMMAEGSKDSWKDEYWTIVLSIPAILAFFPDYVPIVREGFAALDTMPEWYKYSLMGAIAAAFGIRGLSKIRR